MDTSRDHIISSGLYLLIFAVHFGFALWIVLSKKISLAIKLPVSSSRVGVAVNQALASPTGILVGLTLINLPSVLVFWRFELGAIDGERTFFALLLSPVAHASWHAALAFDEWLRAKSVRLRLVFLMNHLLWTALLVTA
ncbi:MAG: hypothetical protein IPJ84_10520 [Bdellovibrionales bacterium]|nr:hypothetical protein [Bdellovibrionales bacterium]